MEREELIKEIKYSIDKSNWMLDPLEWDTYESSEECDRYVKIGEAHVRRVEALTEVLKELRSA